MKWLNEQGIDRMALSAKQTTAYALRDALNKAAQEADSFAYELYDTRDPYSVYDAIKLRLTFTAKARWLTNRHQLSPE